MSRIERGGMRGVKMQTTFSRSLARGDTADSGSTRSGPVQLF